jgi:hypothetical protein
LLQLRARGDVLLQLRARIAAAGVKHVDIAQQTGMNPTAISAILSGRRKMPKRFEARLLRAVGKLEAAERAANAARAKVLKALEDDFR